MAENALVAERMALFSMTTSGRAIQFTNEAFDGDDGYSLVNITARLEGSDYSITKRVTLTPFVDDQTLDIIGADIRRMMILTDEAEQIGSLGPLGEYTGGEQSIATALCSGTSVVNGVGASIDGSIGDGFVSGSSTVSGVGEARSESSALADGTSMVSGVGESIAESSGSVSCTSAASGVGASAFTGDGECSGSSLVSGIGASTFTGIGACSGTSVVSGIEESGLPDDASVEWVSTVLLSLYPFLRERISMGVGSASGSTTVTAVSE